MSELMSRWSKKNLSQIINLVSGILLIMLLINEFTTIDIKCDWFKFVSVVGVDTMPENVLSWGLSILLLNNVAFVLIMYFLRKTFKLNNEIAYYEKIVIVFTAENIVDLVASIYGLLFILVMYNGDVFKYSYLVVFTCCAIGIRFGDSVWHHFYWNNQAIVNKNINPHK